MKKIFSVSFLSVLLAACPLVLLAQHTVKTTTPKARKLYYKSQELYNKGDLEGAREVLEQAVKKDPEFMDAFISLGSLNQQLDRQEAAISWYNRALALDKDYKPAVYLSKAECFWALDQFDSCASTLEKYLAFDRVKGKPRKNAERLMANARFAAVAILHPLPFAPENLGPAVNNADHNYLPSLTADETELIYTTRLNGTNEDFFISRKKDGRWQEAENLGPPVNTPDWNEGAQSITPDGQTLFFAANYPISGHQSFDLFVCHRTDYGWSVPERLPGPVNSVYYESQPSISADGKYLFFVSNRPGTYGSRDIYMAIKDSLGRWSKVVHLDSTINTSWNEEVPFIHPDGRTLYFGSAGHPGMGGADLFYSRRDSANRWSTPVNLGYPINTKGNEGSLFISADGSTGYFSSDREGGYGGFDLYRFEMPENIRPLPVTYVKARVYDGKSGRNLQAVVTLTVLDNPAETRSVTTGKRDGTFLVTLPAGHEWALHVNKPGYLFYSAHYSLSAATRHAPILIEIPLMPVEKGQVLEMHNIFFATDSYQILPASYPELNQLVRLLKKNPGMTIEIGGHTDNTGSKEYNQELSEKRAESVYHYLVEAGIETERMAFHGYGMEKPIDTNETEAGRARNRRVEITITGIRAHGQ